ncbi:MAG: hypothetical protein K8T91_18860 [Planctomycetes bacterium]|nr:hypothetical protein [Planctomycetota bacterium]
MTQCDLDRAVARVTGEDLSTIAGMGFVPLTSVPYETERSPLTVDWDELDAQRTGYFPKRRARRFVTA